ncbi:hypothetical protein CEN49_13835 [Fischerella thermalis CCMEE 5273]|nr:hypothetical protein CEN49_13835 [Fischerella thermalis CCMEE 5273]
MYDKPILGLSFFALSLVSIEQRRAFPISIEQVIKQKAQEAKTIKILEDSMKLWSAFFSPNILLLKDNLEALSQ